MLESVGGECDLDTIDESSILKLTHIDVTLVSMLPTLDLSLE